MKTLLRRFLLVLGPAPLAALTIGAGDVIGKQGEPPTNLLEGVLLLSLIGTVFTLLPAIATTVVIEREFAAGLNPRSGRCLVLLTTLGLASGTAIGLMVTSWWSPLATLLPIMMALGAWTGFLLGLLVRLPCFIPCRRHSV
jgi:hypothetical protein